MATIAALNRYGPDEFEAWLSDRIGGLHAGSPAARREAADLSSFGVDYYDSALDGLELVFRKLKPHAKAAFRKGLGALFQNARPGEFPAEGIADVIMLMGLVEAHAQTRAFESVLGSGYWGEAVPELFTLALGVLKTVGETNNAYRSTQRLLTCANFPRAYVFDAYEVLIDSRPDQWDRDLLWLSERMQRVEADAASSNAPDDRDVLERRYVELADFMIDEIPLERLAEGILRLAKHSHVHDAPQPVRRVIERFGIGVPSGGIKLASHGEARQLQRAGGDVSVDLPDLPDDWQLYVDQHIQFARVNFDSGRGEQAGELRVEVRRSAQTLMSNVRARKPAHEFQVAASVPRAG